MKLDQDYPKVALMVITDGRNDYLEQALRSFEQQCDFPFVQRIISVDADEEMNGLIEATKALPPEQDPPPPGLTCRYSTDEYHIGSHPRMGLAGNIQWGWDHLAPDIEFVFHLEDDFIFPKRVPVREMLSALRAYPNLAQVALKRQPWSPEEQLLGNMLLRIPTLEQMDGLCVHSNLFTFNPCLYPREITRYGAGLEAEVTEKLLADGWKFAYYGGKHDPPRCIHIGHRRSEGYRW